MKRIPPELCARCKGYKRLCGLPRCPLLDAFRAQVSAASRIQGSRVEGSTPPAVLVGEHGYPRIGLYYMVPPGVWGEEASYYEAPVEWAERSTPLHEIIRLRSGLVSAKMRVDARDPGLLYQSEVGLAPLSQRPVDSEAVLARPPTPRLEFNGISKPRGPTAPAVRVRVTGSPRLHPRAEKAIWDDARAAEAVWELYRSGVDVYTIQRLLSLGFLGRLRARRIVPTRWAITAVDDMISQRLRSILRGLDKTVNEYLIYRASYLGNNFTILLMPGEGTVEWIEAWRPRTAWTRTATKTVILRLEEDPLGRRTMDDGGYSAARLPLLDHLARQGRKADAIIFREITPAYYAPVGNWHIRETVARALSQGPVARAGDPGEAYRLLQELLGEDARDLLSASRLLGPQGRRRRRITEFL